MILIKNIVNDLLLTHPKEVNLSYRQHMQHSLKASLYCLLAFFYLAIHAFFPFAFQSSGSSIVALVHKQLKEKSSRHDDSSA